MQDLHLIIVIGYWTTGALPSDTGEKVNLVLLYMEAYLWLLPKIYHTDEITAIHQHFKGLYDINPSKAYGDYLLLKHDHQFRFVSYQTINIQNSFLDRLHENADILKKRNISITLIAGIGEAL